MVSKNGKTKEVLNTRSRAKKGSDISSITKKFSKEALGVFDAIKNPEIATELYKVLTVIQKDKEDGIDYHRIRNFAYHRVLLGHIHIDTQSFQNRRTPYSEYSVQGIVEAVKS